jgi:transposase
MASLQKYSVKGHEYYRIVESRRINGKSRPIPILHIGTREELIQRLLCPSQGQRKIRSFQHGDVACLKSIADRIDAIGIIDSHVPAGRRALSVGTSLLLAAINRASKPRSKRAWADWAKGTSIEKLFHVLLSQLTSQHFWDQMDEVSESALEAIENEITKKIVAEYKLKLDTLFYDPTNFFTYISSENQHSKLAQRGKNKQRRLDLRQFSLALLVARDCQIPLCSHVYEGNKHDSVVFPDSLTLIRKRLEALVGKVEEITLVYDKGNNSRENQKIVDDSKFNYVASLPPTQHKDLLAIRASKYKLLEGSTEATLKTYRCKRTIWGAERTMVLLISENLRQKQMRGLQQHLTKCLKALEEWKTTLSKPNTGPKSKQGATTKINSLVAQQYLKDIVHVEYNGRRKGAARLSWRIDQNAIDNLYAEVFGKRFLMTGRHTWTDGDIVRAYNGQSLVERTFSQIKDPEHLAVRPQFHWTDQKIRIHTFICLLALTLSRLMEREARQHGYKHSLSTLLDELATIRLVLTMTAGTTKTNPINCQWQLEEANDNTLSLFLKLVPNQEPFVYTDTNS